MRYLKFFSVTALGMFCATCAVMAADPKIEEQVVGPVTEKYNNGCPYVVSPRGARLATVMSKGSRVAVTVDGVEGPKFDEIIATSGYLDARPLLEAQHAAAAAGRPGPDTPGARGGVHPWSGPISGGPGHRAGPDRRR